MGWMCQDSTPSCGKGILSQQNSLPSFLFSVLGVLPVGMLWLGCEANYSILPNATVKNEWSCILCPSVWPVGMHRDFIFNFTIVY
jgi:hypothetical protein